MPYSLNCSDAGQDCPFAVTTSTEDELMQHVAAHASAAHPDMELTPETIAQVKGLIPHGLSSKMRHILMTPSARSPPRCSAR